MQTIWQFNTKRFSIDLAWDYENDVDISWDDTGETAEKLQSGEWTCALFRVRVRCDGRTVGEDYLGNSIYANVSEFRDHIGLAAKARADGHNYGSYFTDMVHSAIGEARKALCNAPKVRCA